MTAIRGDRPLCPRRATSLGEVEEGSAVDQRRTRSYRPPRRRRRTQRRSTWFQPRRVALFAAGFTHEQHSRDGSGEPTKLLLPDVVVAQTVGVEL